MRWQGHEETLRQRWEQRSPNFQSCGVTPRLLIYISLCLHPPSIRYVRIKEGQLFSSQKLGFEMGTF